MAKFLQDSFPKKKVLMGKESVSLELDYKSTSWQAERASFGSDGLWIVFCNSDLKQLGTLHTLSVFSLNIVILLI